MRPARPQIKWTISGFSRDRTRRQRRPHEMCGESSFSSIAVPRTLRYPVDQCSSHLPRIVEAPVEK